MQWIVLSSLWATGACILSSFKRVHNYNEKLWINIGWIVFVASIATKLRLQGVTEFELSPGPPPFTVAAYVPGAKVNAVYLLSFLLLIEHFA